MRKGIVHRVLHGILFRSSTIQGGREKVYAHGNTSGAVTVDYNKGHIQTMTLTGNITSMTITNWPPSGQFGSMLLIITQDGTGSRTVAWSGNAVWSSNGTAPTLSTGAADVDRICIDTIDGGTTEYHTVNGLDFA